MLNITEKEFSQQIEDLFSIYHWHWCHFRPARTEHGWRTAISGYKGFVDYIAVRASEGGIARLLFIELKSDKGVISPEQWEWLDLLELCPKVECYLWRPSDNIEEIVAILH